MKEMEQRYPWARKDEEYKHFKSYIRLRWFKFPEVLQFYMNKKGMTSRELAKRCCIPVSLVARARKTEQKLPYTLPIVLGIGLEMSPNEIHFFLSANSTRIPVDAVDDYDQALLYIIDMPYPKSVSECDKMLSDAGLAKLTDFEISVPE